MSSKARRVTDPDTISRFGWGAPVPVESPERHHEPVVAVEQERLAALEREAFAKGYEQGERAGREAAGTRGEAMLRRLTETLGELTTLRADMIRRTERQMVELALAVARRILHREVALDHDLLIAIARVALERLGESAQVTVRLNPDDYEAAGAARIAQAASSNVSVIADPRVGRGGCRIDSDMGMLDAGVDAQIQEIARALLGDEAVAEKVRVD